MLEEDPVKPNNPTSNIVSVSINRWLTVCPLPSKMAVNGFSKSYNPASSVVPAPPMGTHPAPPFQYSSAASAAPLPLVSKSRSAVNS